MRPFEAPWPLPLGWSWVESANGLWELEVPACQLPQQKWLVHLLLAARNNPHLPPSIRNPHLPPGVRISRERIGADSWTWVAKGDGLFAFVEPASPGRIVDYDNEVPDRIEGAPRLAVALALIAHWMVQP